jgi:uncharacterized membrane protein
MQDPLANSIAVIVLIGMVASVIGTAVSFIKGSPSKFLAWPNWIVPVLAILGMGVAGYLSYVDVTKTYAFCGPVGNCNSVQESPYAYLFGVIPVAALGLVGYCLILVAWIFKQFGPQSLKKILALFIWGMAWFGVLFTIYLTFLEPFIIGATCAWCITSAIFMTLILIASTEPAKQEMRLGEDEVDVEYFEELEDNEEQADSNPNTAETA